MIPVQRSVRGRSTIARDRVRTNHEDDIQTHMDGQEGDHIPGVPISAYYPLFGG